MANYKIVDLPQDDKPDRGAKEILGGLATTFAQNVPSLLSAPSHTANAAQSLLKRVLPEGPQLNDQQQQILNYLGQPLESLNKLVQAPIQAVDYASGKIRETGKNIFGDIEPTSDLEKLGQDIAGFAGAQAGGSALGQLAQAAKAGTSVGLGIGKEALKKTSPFLGIKSLSEIPQAYKNGGLLGTAAAIAKNPLAQDVAIIKGFEMADKLGIPQDLQMAGIAIAPLLGKYASKGIDKFSEGNLLKKEVNDLKTSLYNDYLPKEAKKIKIDGSELKDSFKKLRDEVSGLGRGSSHAFFSSEADQKAALHNLDVYRQALGITDKKLAHEMGLTKAEKQLHDIKHNYALQKKQLHEEHGITGHQKKSMHEIAQQKHEDRYDAAIKKQQLAYNQALDRGKYNKAADIKDSIKRLKLEQETKGQSLASIREAVQGHHETLLDKKLKKLESGHKLELSNINKQIKALEIPKKNEPLTLNDLIELKKKINKPFGKLTGDLKRVNDKAFGLVNTEIEKYKDTHPQVYNALKLADELHGYEQMPTTIKDFFKKYDLSPHDLVPAKYAPLLEIGGKAGTVASFLYAPKITAIAGTALKGKALYNAQKQHSLFRDALKKPQYQEIAAQVIQKVKDASESYRVRPDDIASSRMLYSSLINFSRTMENIEKQEEQEGSFQRDITTGNYKIVDLPR